MTLSATWPPSLSTVKAHLGITDGSDDAAITQATDAAASWVTARCRGQLDSLTTVDPAAGTASTVVAAEQPAHIILGTVMLAARLFHRRNSPAGLVSFQEWGAAQLGRSDPDIARLLRIDAFAKPGVS